MNTRLNKFNQSMLQVVNESKIPRNASLLVSQIHKSITELEISPNDIIDSGKDYGFTFDDGGKTFEIKYIYNTGEIVMTEDGKEIINDIEDVDIPVAYILDL